MSNVVHILHPKSVIFCLAASGEMAALPHYSDLCDSPHGSPHPHLCVFPLLVHLSGPQKEADKVVLVGLRTEGVISYFFPGKLGGGLSRARYLLTSSGQLAGRWERQLEST